MNTGKKIVLSLALLSYFIVGIDASIVITGLTRITADLGLSHEELSWVQNTYLFSFGGFMLMGGGLGDAFGRKRIFNLSLILFGIGSLGAGIAGTAGMMIAARFVQGLGSALMAPASLALIMDYFNGRERVRAVAWYGSISGLGLCVGLILGGAITGYASWRDGFLVNIPIIAVMLLFSVHTLSGSAPVKAKFDIKGTLLSVSGVFCLLYAIDGAESMAIWLAAGLLLMSAFVFVEHNSSKPIMPLRLFGNTDRRNAYIMRVLFVGAMMGFNFFVSEFMQEVFRFSPLQAGCAFLPMTVSTFVGAIRVPSLVARHGNKRVLAFGLSLLTIGFCALLPLDSSGNYFTGIALPMLFIGFGGGFSLSPMTNLGIAGVAHEDAGAASGLVNVAHQVGGAFGLSFMVAASGGLADMTARFHTGMLVALGCAATALLISCLPALIKYLFKQDARQTT